MMDQFQEEVSANLLKTQVEESRTFELRLGTRPRTRSRKNCVEDLKPDRDMILEDANRCDVKMNVVVESIYYHFC